MYLKFNIIFIRGLYIFGKIFKFINKQYHLLEMDLNF